MKRREFIETLPFALSLTLVSPSLRLQKLESPDTCSDLSLSSLRSILIELLPKDNFNRNDDYETLLAELFHSNIRTQDQLKILVRNNLQYVLEMERGLVTNAMLKNHFVSLTEKPHDKVDLYFSHVGIVRYIIINWRNNKRSSDVYPSC